MVERKMIIFLLYIAATFALPISDTADQDQVIVITGPKSTEEKPTVHPTDADVPEEDSSKNGSNTNSSNEVTSREVSATTEFPTVMTTELDIQNILIHPDDLPDFCFENITLQIVHPV